MRNILLVIGFLLLAPAVASAEVRLRTESGFLYDIQDTGVAGAGGGQVALGTEVSGRTAFSGGFHLVVRRSGRPAQCYDTANQAAARNLGGREAELAEFRIDGTSVYVSRRVYVPNENGEYVRYLELFRNDGTSTVTVDASIVGDHGDPAAEIVLSGDSVLNDPSVTGRFRNDIAGTTDTWVMVDDRDAQGIPTLVHVMQGYEAGIAPGTVRTSCVAIAPYDETSDRCDGPQRDPCGSGDGMTGFRYDYQFDVPPGETRAILHFGIQSSNQRNAIREADRLLGLPEDVLVGIPDEVLPNIVNFKVAGWPQIQLMHPVAVDEGEAIVVTADVSDLEGDAVSWSWDLPTRGSEGETDGVFGEMPNAMTVTVPADITNGEYYWKVRIRAVEDGDPTSARTAVAVIDVRNVPPVISSIPQTPRLFVGDDYSYQVVVSDAPGEAESIGYLLRTAPSGMMRNSEGLITWTVEERHRGQTHLVVLEVSDDRGDRASQSWELTVENNLRPQPPTPVSPIDLVMIAERQPTLRIENGTDTEGDPLRYIFRLDTNVTNFAEGREALFTSPFVPEDSSGFTEWLVPMRLEPGTYFWEVRAKDDLPDDEAEAFSEARYASFNVFTERPPDAGTPVTPFRPSDGGGCRVGASGQAPAPVLWLVGLGVVVLGVRRRRG